MGLISNQMKPDEAEVPGAVEQPGEQEPQGQDESHGGSEATPQEQDAYNRVVMAGMKILYEDQDSHDAVMKMLDGGEAPEKDISDTVVMIMSQIDKKSGGKVPQVVIIPAAVELVSLAAELGEKAGIFQADDSVIARAVQMVIIGLCNEYGVSPEEIAQVMKSVDQKQVAQMVQDQRKMTAGGGGQPAPQPAQQPAPQGAPVEE